MMRALSCSALCTGRFRSVAEGLYRRMYRLYRSGVQALLDLFDTSGCCRALARGAQPGPLERALCATLRSPSRRLALVVGSERHHLPHEGPRRARAGLPHCRTSRNQSLRCDPRAEFTDQHSIAIESRCSFRFAEVLRLSWSAPTRQGHSARVQFAG